MSGVGGASSRVARVGSKSRDDRCDQAKSVRSIRPFGVLSAVGRSRASHPHPSCCPVAAPMVTKGYQGQGYGMYPPKGAAPVPANPGYAPTYQQVRAIPLERSKNHSHSQIRGVGHVPYVWSALSLSRHSCGRLSHCLDTRVVGSLTIPFDSWHAVV